MNSTLSTNTTLIICKIGEGGIGQVHRACDSRVGREVAIKMLPANYATDADRLKRFEQKARNTSALNHPNILTVYDIGTHDGLPYIVSEVLHGEELRQQLTSSVFLGGKRSITLNKSCTDLRRYTTKGLFILVETLFPIRCTRMMKNG